MNGPTSLHHWCAILLLCAPAAGCVSPASVVDDHRATAQARLDAFAKIETDARGRPPVTRTELADLPAALDLGLDGGFDTAVVLLDMLAAPCDAELHFGGDAKAPRIDMARLPTSPKLWWRYSACYTKGGKPPAGEREPSPEKLGRWFDQLEGVQHLIVVRYHEYAEPTVLGDAVSGSRFASGRIVGDGLVYRVDDAGYLGGFPFTVDSSAQTSTSPNSAINSAADAVANDFWDRTTAAIEDAIESNVPGASVR